MTDNFKIKLKQDPLYEEYLKDNLFNFGGKVLEVGKHNGLNLKSYLDLKPYLKNSRNALDIGARWGEWARIMQDDFQQVYCFEPHPKRFCLIPENCDINKVTLYGCCLGNENQRVRMYGGCIYDPNKKGIKKDVRHDYKISTRQSIKLDEFNIPEVDFIKIDVEGFELPVLQGGLKTILEWKPVICLEQNGSEEKWRGAKRNEASEFLLKIGMKLEKQLNYQDFLFTWPDKN